MSKTRFEWNYEAAGDLLLRSPEIASVCESVAEKMTRAAGVKYRADVHMGKTRVNAAARGRADEVADYRKGKRVKSYVRTLKDGTKVTVRGYRRRK